MADTATRRHGALWFAPVLTMLGVAGILVTLMLGFEEPNDFMLGTSSVLVFTGPVATVLHVLVAQDLDKSERRELLRYLFSRRASDALSVYLASPSCAAALLQLRQRIANEHVSEREGL